MGEEELKREIKNSVRKLIKLRQITCVAIQGAQKVLKNTIKPRASNGNHIAGRRIISPADRGY